MAATTARVRVLHLVKTSVGATWALRQMRELVRLGIEVYAALPPGGPLLTQYERAGVIVHPVSLDFPMRKPGHWPGLIKRMRELVSAVRPDLIHSHHVGTTITMRLALGKKGVPRLFQVPGPLHLENPILGRLDVGAATELDHWIGSCQYTCDLYRRLGVRSDRLFLSYYGTDLEMFEDRKRGCLRRELQIGSHAKLVGMVAYIYAPKWFLGQTRGLKGHEDLIDALVLCCQERADLMGVFIGGAWGGATAYERRVREYGRRRCGKRVMFLGTRSNVPDLYPDLDVAVHPSRSENVGGAVESLLLGVPTIASQVGGLPEVVKPGVTGWLVPPGKPEILAETILEVLDNAERAREMAQRGRDLVSGLFDVRRTAAEVAEIYEQVLSRPR